MGCYRDHQVGVLLGLGVEPEQISHKRDIAKQPNFLQVANVSLLEQPADDQRLPLKQVDLRLRLPSGDLGVST